MVNDGNSEKNNVEKSNVTQNLDTVLTEEEWLERCLDFVREAEGLKSVLRTAWTKSGRQESTAEHSWRLSLLAALFLPRYPDLNGEKVLLLCLVHDLGELYDGDISAALGADEEKKHREERAAVERAGSLLPKPEANRIQELWSEYNSAATREARLVKALDKAETILQHNQGMNPTGFDYAFNLTYGKDYFKDGDILEKLRACLDRDTERRLAEERTAR